MYATFFRNLSTIISEKCVVTPNFLFGFQQPLPRSTFFPHSHKPPKNTFVLVGTVLKKHKFLRTSRDGLNVCAVTKGGTVLKVVQARIFVMRYF